MLTNRALAERYGLLLDRIRTQPAMESPEAIWFGSDDQPLAGFLHAPAGECTGGVLICGPFGYEATCAHRTLRRLADRLAANGKLVLRFDYAGTGASAGSGTALNTFEQWQDSVSSGVEELRRRGVARPALAGLRLGAALACARASKDAELGPLVLWAPVTSGRRYQRELRGQAAITPGGVVGAGALNVFGHLVPATAVSELKTWKPLAGLRPSSDVLLVQSPGWRDLDDAASDIRGAGLEHTYLEADGTADFMERDAEVADVPVKLIESICEWLTPRAAGPVTTRSVRAAREISTRTLLDHDVAVEERIVAVPGTGAYGVLTGPVGRVPRRGVLFLNNGVTPATGPARAWVEFARALVADDVCSLRLDFRGLGDSPDPSRRPVTREYPIRHSAGREVLAAVDYLRSCGVNEITAVGLCSGAQVAVRTIAERGHVESILAINPPLYYQLDIGLGSWWRPVSALIGFAMSKARLRGPAFRLPRVCWVLLDRIGAFPSPATFLRRATAGGAHIELVYSEDDPSLTDLHVRGGRAVSELQSAGRITVQVVKGMDHSMFDRERRAGVFADLRRLCAVRSSEPAPQALLQPPVGA